MVNKALLKLLCLFFYCIFLYVLHMVAYSYKISTGGACLQLNVRRLYHLTIPIIGLVTATLTKICFNLWLHVLLQKPYKFNEKIQYFASSSKFNVWYVKCISNVLWKGDFSEKFLKIHRETSVPDSLFNIVENLQEIFTEKDTSAKVFSCEFYEIFKAALLQNRSDTLLLLLLRLVLFLLLSIPDKFVLNFLNNCSLIVRDLFIPQNLLPIWQNFSNAI